MLDKKEFNPHRFISECFDRCKDDKYIFRGESMKFPQPMSSGLHRHFCQKRGDAPPLITSKYFSVVQAEEEVAEEARRHASAGARPIDILTELQHYGGNTALIDFTYNLHIALFLACEKDSEESGYLYFFKEESFGKKKPDIKYTSDDCKKDILIEPAGKNPRAIFQSSVFVHSHRGYLEVRDDGCVKVPKEYKKTILTYLDRRFSVNVKTIYNDMYGFIQHQHRHDAHADIEFYKGLDAYDAGDYDKAMEYYNKALELNPKHAGAFSNRGLAIRDAKRKTDN